jgi:hypothetical protein
MKILLLLFALTTLCCFGQTDSSRYYLLSALTKDLHKYYVSASLADKMSNTIMLKFSNGGYNSTSNLDEFAYEITKDLRIVSNDNHILIMPPYVRNLNSSDSLKTYSSEGEKTKIKYNESHSFGSNCYGEIKIMAGKIGYLEIRNFNSRSSREEARESLSLNRIFSFFKNTNSLIIDLRENSGGANTEVLNFCSFFSERPNNYFITTKRFFRYDSSGVGVEISDQKRYFTNKNVTNKSIKGKKIFILISQRTFSAAELAAYKIKKYMPESIIVGERTTGGGNGHDGIRFQMYYSGIIPLYQGIDEEYENYNFQGIGITPDILANADEAFDIAYKKALEENKDTIDEKTRYLHKNEVIDHNGFENLLLEEYTGKYYKGFVFQQENRLYLLYDMLDKILLVPESKDTFKSKNFQSVKFIRNQYNKISGIEIHQKNGYSEHFSRE